MTATSTFLMYQLNSTNNLSGSSPGPFLLSQGFVEYLENPLNASHFDLGMLVFFFNLRHN